MVAHHRQKELVLSFGFDRALFEKIEWNNFEVFNLRLVAPEFQFSQWTQAHFDDEHEAREDNN